MTVPCAHCGKSTIFRYICREDSCKGGALCLDCAREAGLFGVRKPPPLKPAPPPKGQR